MLHWFELSQVYHPDKIMHATGAELCRPFEEVRFQAADGVTLHGWFFPADDGSARLRPAALVCHGNAGNISTRLDLCGALLQAGLSVFLFDYRGYGRSQGRPSEQGTYLDAQAAYAWLVKRGFPGPTIVAFGESLGGGIASELAMREVLGGLVLQATFTSIPDIGAELFPWLFVRRLGRIKYDTCARLPQLKIPVMVMHSRADQLVPFHHAERNFAAALEPKLFWELRGPHNDPLADRRHFIAGMGKLLALLPAFRAPTVPSGSA